jgi:DNA-directed RNA polymerase subunit beta
VSVVEEVTHPKTDKKLASPGTKVTKKLIEQLKQAGVKKVVLTVSEAYSDILGRFLAEDVVDESTGEILGECFEKITTLFMMRCAQCGIEEVKAIKVEHEDTNVILCTLAKDKVKSYEEAVIEFFKKMRPGNPITLPAAVRLVHDMFFNDKRYDLGLVGRHKISSRYGVREDAENLPRTLAIQDVVQIVRHMLDLVEEKAEVDDIDHLATAVCVRWANCSRTRSAWRWPTSRRRRASAWPSVSATSKACCRTGSSTPSRWTRRSRISLAARS